MKFSIITACKNRLAHLKQSLPAMLAQPDSEVIVVDFNCSEGTTRFVRSTYPQANVVYVPEKPYFSNWEARNSGAKAAKGDWLIFVDADIVLSATCTQWLGQHLIPGTFAKFPPGEKLERHRSRTSAISLNNLQGFLVIERSAFQKVGGYDELLRGWGAGGDVDIQNALAEAKIKRVYLPEDVVEQVIEHDDEMRFAHTGGSFRRNFIQNLLYRELKRFLYSILGVPIPLEVRQKIFAAAVKAAVTAKDRLPSARADVILARRPVEMRRRLGHPNSEIQISLRATVDHLEVPQPDQPGAPGQQQPAAAVPPQPVKTT